MGSFIGADGRSYSYIGSARAIARLIESCKISMKDLQDLERLPLTMIARMTYEMTGGQKMFGDFETFVDRVFPPKMWVDSEIVSGVVSEFVDAFGFNEAADESPLEKAASGE